jgi:hypothetical protein
LLRGIIYSKPRQYNPKTDTFRVTNKNYAALQQVQAVVESLGHRTTLREDEGNKNFSLVFKSKLKLVSNQTSTPLKIIYGRRKIKTIEEIPAQLCVHIETTAPDNTLVVGEGFISTC